MKDIIKMVFDTTISCMLCILSLIVTGTLIILLVWFCVWIASFGVIGSILGTILIFITLCTSISIFIHLISGDFEGIFTKGE